MSVAVCANSTVCVSFVCVQSLSIYLHDMTCQLYMHRCGVTLTRVAVLARQLA